MAEIASLLLEFPPAQRLSGEEYDKRIKSFIAALDQITAAKLYTADSQQDLLEVIIPLLAEIALALTNLMIDT
jgi:hypothetical protein